MPAEEVKIGERTLEKLHSSENLLKHFRMQSYDSGFAAGDSHFLSILNNLSDVSEAVKFHFETDSCSAPITLKNIRQHLVGPHCWPNPNQLGFKLCLQSFRGDRTPAKQLSH